MAKRPGQVSDWDLLRTFRDCAHFNSFTSAAEKLGVTPGMLTRRMDRLEIDMGAPLFQRTNQGFKLTAEGRALRDECERISETLMSLARWMTKDNAPENRTLNFNCTEGLASYWISKFIRVFQTENSTVSLRLHTDTRITEDKRPTFDAQVQVFPPVDPNIVDGRLLGHMHFLPFASRDYLDANPEPVSMQTIGRHHWVDYIPLSVEQGGYSSWFGDAALRHQASVITSVTATAVGAITGGGGIGMLPTYFAITEDNLVPLDFGPKYFYPIWLNAGPMSSMPWHVRALSNFLDSIIDPGAMPWFRKDLVMPSEFPDAVEKLNPSIKDALKRQGRGPNGAHR